MYQSATQFGAEYAYGTVTAVKLDGTDRIVVTDDGEYRAKAVIVATGSKTGNWAFLVKKSTAVGEFPTVPFVTGPSSATGM